MYVKPRLLEKQNNRKGGGKGNVCKNEFNQSTKMHLHKPVVMKTNCMYKKPI